MLWVIMSITAAICCIVASFYFYKLILRFLSLIFPDRRLRRGTKILFGVISVCLGILSGNLFSTTGVLLVHIMVAALIMEPVHLIVRRRLKGRMPKGWNIVYKGLFVPFLVTALIFAYGYYNIRDVRETYYEVTTGKEMKLPDGNTKLRLLLVTDSHYGTIFGKETLQQLKKRMEAVKPDLVVLAGDIVDESTTREQMREIFQAFGSISSSYGSYYVYGNHDRQRYSRHPYYTPEELESTIVECGIRVLTDKYVRITEGVTLAGREDASARYGRRNVKELLKGVDPADYLIVADHQPVEYRENEAAKADLIVSGHTHAGQLFPSGYVMKWFHTSDLYYGHEKYGSMDAVVSSGVAGWGYPIRTQNHSEFTIVDIVPGAQQGKDNK